MMPSNARKHPFLMAIMKTLSYGIVLSALATNLTPAWADACGDIRAKVGKIQSDMTRQEAEKTRVERIKPTPHTDAALCKVTLKIIDEAGYLIFHSHDGNCYSNPDVLFNAASEANKGANIIAGLFHCTR